MTLLLNLLAFQIGWFACVLAAARDLPWLGTGIALLIVAWHILRLPAPAAEFRLVLLIGLLGLLLDSLPVLLGLIDYASGTLVAGLPPHWIVAMWLLFATLPNISLRWLAERPALAALLGALGGPLAYYAGVALGAAQFNAPLWQPLTLLAINWAIAMPLIMMLAARHDGTAETDRRIGSPDGSARAERSE
jgi:hypothetical protein